MAVSTVAKPVMTITSIPSSFDGYAENLHTVDTRHLEIEQYEAG